VALSRQMRGFRRKTAAARREALIDATLQNLQRYGHAGTSIRRISAAAGVSIGLINHHFKAKSELIAAAYESLALSLQKSLRDRAQDDSANARDRISGFFRASFGPEFLDPAVFNTWLVFWSMVLHSPQMRAVHDRTYRRYRSLLESLLESLVAAGDAPRFTPRRAAIALSALLDGLWVEISLNPATFKPAEAVAICEDWVDALCSASLPRMQRAPARRRRSARSGRG